MTRALVAPDGKTYTNNIGVKGLFFDTVLDACLDIDYEAKTLRMGLFLDTRDGAIANFTDDMKQTNISSSGFKSFASGEKFQARHPYGHKIFKVKAPPLLCCANSLPTTTDDSWGYHRRILPIYSSTEYDILTLRSSLNADRTLPESPAP